MTAVGDVFDTKRSPEIWLLAAVLWALRMATKPLVVFGSLFALYGLFGLLLFGRMEPALMTALGCTALIVLLLKLHEEGSR